MHKTHQATAKRFRFTKGGKVMKKKAGQDHFNARESGTVTRAKRRNVEMGHQYHKTIHSLTPFN